MTLETVIMTTPRLGTPHLANVQRDNPIVHVHHGKDGVTDAERIQLWRNCDRAIRDWWRANRHQVHADHVAFVEWDVVVNLDLRRCIVPGAGLVGATVEHPAVSPWSWWSEIERLPTDLRRNAASLRPLGVVIASRECLDAIAAPEWDDAFALDIFCELRLPTVVKACGFRLMASSHLANVRHFPIPHPGDKPGVWHQVKKPLASPSPGL
jgi:hypothetical protein